ncbi:unnamed protein product (macronuclear) [Paramecium tetraurelia]|uniref:Abscisic acid G-protein coupled receptor-like domain-containing protein n=1 Tax=Paramecium tetraurelia TaxID=5888 RepID=A0D350_PARTE|nr:uncharacterized protein GSPATT00012952001 [Paramecium tetraurelia]CAK77467.1 unnamed protein product [Paramecium tetraurelia]|eukprot:XP_001444864.1 hypothetical protein (macronuclear) [Paramecium tetraurelia strain d4-2]
MNSERISYMTCRDNLEQDKFYSVFDDQLPNRECRPTIYVRPQQKNRNTLQLRSIQESSTEPLLSNGIQGTQLSELVPRKRQVVPIGQAKRNRIETLLLRSRPQSKGFQQECSLDTSAALIKLMNKNRWVRYLMNLYIWLNIALRIGYVAIVVFYVIQNDYNEVQDENSEEIMTQFYWWIPGSFIGIRVIFILIIYKLLSVGEQTRDGRIKVVYDTYEAWFNKTINERDQLLMKCNSMVIRNGQDELELRQLQQQVNSLNRWLLILKTYIVLIPPECQFIFLKQKSNGFFQVQNFIMKSLEILFFTPQLMYFLLIEEPLDLELDRWSAYDVNNICLLVLLADIICFVFMTLLLICLGNNRKYVNNLRTN